MEILGERVVVVARGWLAGLAETSAVIGNDAVPCVQKNWHLLLPRSTAQRISMDKYYSITRAMIFVIEFDVCGVFFPDICVWH